MKNIGVLLVVIIAFVSCKKVDTTDDILIYSCSVFQGVSVPVVEDSIKYFIDTASFHFALSGGKGVFWDFTGLNKQDSITVYFNDKKGLKHSPLFPTSDFVSTLNDELVYLALNSNGLEVQGAIINVSDTQFVASYNKAYKHYDFPLKYNQSLTSSYSYRDMMYELVIDVDGKPIYADSLEIFRTGTITKKVDGCGKLKNANGTYEVLRIYKEETISDTSIAHVFKGIGTKPVTFVEEENIFRTYEFVTDSLNSPIMIIDLDENKQAKSVRFRN
tara:strand:- start:1510 stop:2331 length:822 start_codon:yes stop_codon:yes gene_type:complete